MLDVNLCTQVHANLENKKKIHPRRLRRAITSMRKEMGEFGADVLLRLAAESKWKQRVEEV